MLARLFRPSLIAQQHRAFSQCALLLKGHSKWQNIKETKGKNDAIRARKISFLLQKVRSAVRSGGFDMKSNTELAALQLEFRAHSLPLDSFKNFLVKLKNKPESTIFYELIGPSGTFFIIETETDSQTRTKQAITKYAKKSGGFRFATDLRRRFDEKIIATVPAKNNEKDLSLDEVEEIAIELDCEGVTAQKDDDESGSRYELTFDLQNLTTLEAEIKKKGLDVENLEQRLIPIHRVELTGNDIDTVEKFYTNMQEVEEIKNIYDNVE